MSLVYRTSSLSQVVVITDEVMNLFDCHRQLDGMPEAGGQLFARWNKDKITIGKATGVRQGDKRARFSFRPHRKAEQKEIEQEFAGGWHFVGDWHTHPQEEPQPSDLDLDSIQECVALSEHSLAGFFLIIVGLKDPPKGYWVSFHQGETYSRLSGE